MLRPPPAPDTFSATADLSTSKVFNAEGSLHSRRTEQSEVGGCEEVQLTIVLATICLSAHEKLRAIAHSDVS